MGTKGKVGIALFLLVSASVALFGIFGSEGRNDELQPQNEFKLEPWIPLKLGPIDMSINKGVLYIVLAALLDPLISWWGYAILQFILISEAWFIFGQTRPSIAVGNVLQRYVTTTEPRRAQLEVAVQSLNKLLQAEEKREDGMTPLRLPARY